MVGGDHRVRTPLIGFSTSDGSRCDGGSPTGLEAVKVTNEGTAHETLIVLVGSVVLGPLRV